MKMKACGEFYFDAAHTLPGHNGKCKHLHGHTYKLEVVIKGETGKDGMILDFGELKKTVKEDVLNELDHTNLNEIFDNPTAENMAQWIFNKLKNKLPLFSVKLWEGTKNWVEVTE